MRKVSKAKTLTVQLTAGEASYSLKVTQLNSFFSFTHEVIFFFSAHRKRILFEMC